MIVLKEREREERMNERWYDILKVKVASYWVRFPKLLDVLWAVEQLGQQAA